MTSFTEKNYDKISLEDFYDGMFVNAEIYYYVNGKYVLAFKNSTINSSILSKLRGLEKLYGGLYVLSGESQGFIELLSAQAEKRQYNELVEEHDRIIGATCSLYDEALKTNKVDLESSEKIAINLKNNLYTVKAANIIQIISGVRNSDQYLFSHSKNVAILNGLMGKWMGLSDNDIERLIKIGLLHDIGKIRMPNEIINKPGKLTSAEFDIMKVHPVFSHEMAKASGECDEDILRAIRGHHEKTNGTGYPDRLQANELNLFTKITTISDIYDAMVAKRVYKDAHSPFEILSELSQDKFSNLDTCLINIFLKNMPSELSGKNVLLSDGRTGKIVYINSNKLAFPFVQVENEVIETSEKLKCLSLVTV